MATMTSFGSKLQQKLQLVVQSLRWTYGVYWKFCSQQGVLVWGDGCYNGAIKTRKTVQPMEVSREEMSVQRSQQLRELYRFLSAGLETNQQPPVRRPCTALSPEDLSELEWFYLMCVSFSFPPGVGLPGKALAEQHRVWITGADQADSKFFPRAILAKNAGIQTVVCIPLFKGVLELGNTDKVDEDMGLIHRVSNLFLEEEEEEESAAAAAEALLINQLLQKNQQRPQVSDHSTSLQSTAQPLFPSPVLADQFVPTQEDDINDDPDVGRGSDDETNCGFGREEELEEEEEESAADAVESSELVKMEMSDELGSATDHPLSSDLKKEDAHYRWTVSVILQDNRNPWTDFCSNAFFKSSQNSAFSGWKNSTGGTLLPLPAKTSSQKTLKNILFNVPLLHKKNGEGGDGEQQMRRRRKRQEVLDGSHVMAERRRRDRINERFITLRSLVPLVTKMDKASILSDTIEYVKQLKMHIQELESQAKRLHVNSSGSSQTDTTKLSSGRCRSASTELAHQNKRKSRSSTTAAGSTRLVTQGGSSADTTSSLKLQVSIIEADVLLELQCPRREGLLLMIMQKLHDLQLEVTSVRSISTEEGNLVADLRAKVKDDSHGRRKASIVEVKKAIQKVLSP